MVELADSLDSGSSAHYGRAGSSPASRTNEKVLKPKGFRTFSFFVPKKTMGEKEQFSNTFSNKHAAFVQGAFRTEYWSGSPFLPFQGVRRC